MLEEVEKFRLCGEKEAGFSLFACDCCGKIKIVPHRCKVRFCSACATGYMQEWSRKTAEWSMSAVSSGGALKISDNTSITVKDRNSLDMTDE